MKEKDSMLTSCN